MTLDYTKTATPCELVAHLIPAVTGKLWSTGTRWHGRHHDGTWRPGRQRGIHLGILAEALETLPPGNRWDRFRDLMAYNAGHYQALRWLMKARDGGYLPRPGDYLTPDRFKPRNDLGCLCGNDCWKSLRPSLPALDPSMKSTS